MAEEYLEGDPRADDDRFLFTDLGPYVASVHRELKCLHDLVKAKRYEEAEVLACEQWVRATMLLERLEQQTLPEVDLTQTIDATDQRSRVYRS